ncbi:MAG: sulfate adenylyltransferase, partial [Deltaproteobacteria bacterium]|nr:sulfate adenylyltransferase [Deltaproteobacteria bacterium]
MTASIEAHGGTLINRLLEGKEREEAVKKAEGLKKIALNNFEMSDLEMIAIGGFSPLEGFMCKDDYHSVMDTMKLTDGNPWTIPVVLSVSTEKAEELNEGDDVTLTDGEGTVLGILHLSEKFPHDKEKEALQVYG